MGRRTQSAETPVVGGDDARPWGERRGDGAPVVPEPRPAMKQDDRRTGPLRDVMERHAVNAGATRVTPGVVVGPRHRSDWPQPSLVRSDHHAAERMGIAVP